MSSLEAFEHNGFDVHRRSQQPGSRHEVHPGALSALIVGCFSYWLLGGLLPVATLVYGQKGAFAREGLVRLSLRVYSHLFLFPVTCGILIVGLLIHPLSFLLRQLRRAKRSIRAPEPNGDEIGWARLIFVSWTLATLLVAVGDFFAGNHAIWQIDPRVLDGKPLLVKHFRNPTPEFRDEYARTIDELIQDRATGRGRNGAPGSGSCPRSAPCSQSPTL